MEFTLIKPLFGGFLLGLAALSLLFFNGRVAGVSGILGGFLSFKKHRNIIFSRQCGRGDGADQPSWSKCWKWRI